MQRLFEPIIIKQNYHCLVTYNRLNNLFNVKYSLFKQISRIHYLASDLLDVHCVHKKAAP